MSQMLEADDGGSSCGGSSCAGRAWQGAFAAPHTRQWSMQMLCIWMTARGHQGPCAIISCCLCARHWALCTRHTDHASLQSRHSQAAPTDDRLQGGAPEMGHELGLRGFPLDHPHQLPGHDAAVGQPVHLPLQGHILGVVAPVPELLRCSVPVQVQQPREAAQPGSLLSVLLRLLCAPSCQMCVLGCRMTQGHTLPHLT